jgi:ribonuclease-3
MIPDDALLEERLGYGFTNRELLDRALTHSSAIAESSSVGNRSQADLPQRQDNEQLEFLGDAVLDMLASEYLLVRFPNWTEGQLSKSRARLVNARSLEMAARRLEIGAHLRLGKGEEKTGGREKATLLADALEAIVAGIYLDGGLTATNDFLARVLFAQALEDRGERLAESDRKSALQEFLQARGESPAEYRLAGSKGPDHRKTFQIEVWTGGSCLARAEGATKKEAEQRAARLALEHLQGSSENQR